MPRRVRLETEDDIGPLRDLAEVSTVRALPANGQARAQAGPPASTCWEVELRENSDPQVILQTCFGRRIRLKSFNQSQPTLHEVFIHLVGPDAKEVLSR